MYILLCYADAAAHRATPVDQGAATSTYHYQISLHIRYHLSLNITSIVKYYLSLNITYIKCYKCPRGPPVPPYSM